MTAPFQASKLFQNSSNEGWDDWDWVDNSVSNSNVRDANQNIHSTATSVQYSVHSQPAEINVLYSNVPSHTNLPVATNNNEMVPSEQNEQHFSQPNQSSIQDFNNSPFMNTSSPPQVLHSHNNQNEQVSTMNMSGQNFDMNLQHTDDAYKNIRQSNFVQPAVQTPFYPNVSQQNFENPIATSSNSHISDANAVHSIPTLPNPPRSTSPPPLDKSPYANTNPFKRVSMHSYKLPPGLSTQQVTSDATTISPPSLPPVNQRSVTLGNSEGFSSTAQPAFENAEPPQNERNQYLQTGHLSDEGVDLVALSPNSENNNYNDNLPPPGLSRLVLGEPEASPVNQSNHLPSHPPPLNRMIPGDETGSEINLNLERQADGQDVSPPSIQSRNMSQFTVPTTHLNQAHQNENQTSRNITDRNLYLVAGESNTEVPNMQRVVTGVDNRTIETTVTEPRELVMDGENLNDNRQIPPPPVSVREEPIEGANTSDDLPNQSSLNQHQSQVDAAENVIAHPSNSKYNSNPSTGNEDSDRDKGYYKQGGDDRRSEERGKKKGRQYETEDTDHSTRDSRRYRDDRNRSDKRDRKEKDSSKNRDKYSQRSQKDRSSNRDRYYRDDKDESNYDRKHSDRHKESDKYSRYETDGSRYDTEDPKYERRERRKNERDHGRYRDGRSDRQHRRNRDVEDRERGKLKFNFKIPI